MEYMLSRCETEGKRLLLKKLTDNPVGTEYFEFLEAPEKYLSNPKPLRLDCAEWLVYVLALFVLPQKLCL